MVDQDPSHNASRDAQELRPIPPVHPPLVHQPEVGLVYQGGRLQGVAGGFAAQAVGGEAVQLLVDDREHLIESPLVAVAPVQQPLGDSTLGGGGIVWHR